MLNSSTIPNLNWVNIPAVYYIFLTMPQCAFHVNSIKNIPYDPFSIIYICIFRKLWKWSGSLIIEILAIIAYT